MGKNLVQLLAGASSLSYCGELCVVVTWCLFLLRSRFGLDSPEQLEDGTALQLHVLFDYLNAPFAQGGGQPFAGHSQCHEFRRINLQCRSPCDP